MANFTFILSCLNTFRLLLLALNYVNGPEWMVLWQKGNLVVARVWVIQVLKQMKVTAEKANQNQLISGLTGFCLLTIMTGLPICFGGALDLLGGRKKQGG